MLDTTNERTASGDGGVAATRLPRNNIMAVFRDLTSARRAIAALGRNNIKPDKISLTGPEGETRVEDEPYRTELEIFLAQFMANRVAVGATVGGLAGAGVVFIFAVAVFGGSISFITILATMVFSGIGTAAIGGFIAGSDVIQAAPEVSPEEPEGPAIVAVHAEKREDLAVVADVLQEQHPVEVFRTDSRGRRLPLVPRASM